jgi:cytoskeleton protein RodZ
MSDVPDSSPASDAPASPDVTPSGPGSWLKQEREKQGLTVQRVAADMHLSTMAIEALESNRFTALGAPVFAKGHLRKYASLLGLPSGEVTEQYERHGDSRKTVDPVPITPRPQESLSRPPIRDLLSFGSESKSRAGHGWIWIAAAAVLVVVAAGAWWLLAYRERPSMEAARNPSQVSAGVPEPQAEVAVDAKSPESEPSSPVTEAEVPAQAAPRPARPAGPPPPGKVRIRLTFTRDSWVEVYDVNGNRMLYDVGRVDFPRMVDVEPPALIVLGDANAVTAEANDRALAIPKKNISGTVARFTIAADGTVK